MVLVVAAPRLQSTGSIVVVLCGMWDLHGQVDSLLLSHPGRPVTALALANIYKYPTRARYCFWQLGHISEQNIQKSLPLWIVLFSKIWIINNTYLKK